MSNVMEGGSVRIDASARTKSIAAVDPYSVRLGFLLALLVGALAFSCYSLYVYRGHSTPAWSSKSVTTVDKLLEATMYHLDEMLKATTHSVDKMCEVTQNSVNNLAYGRCYTQFCETRLTEITKHGVDKVSEAVKHSVDTTTKAILEVAKLLVSEQDRPLTTKDSCFRSSPPTQPRKQS